MRIHSVILKDFRQYKGEQKVEFADKEKITVIEGPNGAGKSNLFKSIQWCMYGSDILEKSEDQVPLINEETLRRMDEGERSKVKVEIKLGEENPQYTVTREANIKKNKFSAEMTYEDFYIMEKEESGWKDHNDYESEALIQRILPSKIKNFYFFDGEQLDTYFRQGTERKVKSTVEEVSQIDILDLAVEHMNNTEGNLSREYKGEIGDKIEKKTEAIERKKGEIEEIKKKLESLDEDIQRKKTEIDKIDQKLGDTDISSVKNQQQKREELKNELDTLNNQISEEKKKLREQIIEDSPKILAKDALEIAKQEIDKKDEEVGLPPNIRATFVKALIDSGECICGNHIQEEEENNLEKVMQDESIDGVSSMAIDGKYKTRDALSEIEEFNNFSKDVISRINSKENRKGEIKDKIEKISDTLQGIGKEEDLDIGQLETDRKQLVEDKEKLVNEEGRKEQRLNRLKNEKDELEKERSKLTSRRSKNKELNNKMEAMQKGKELLKDVKEDILQEVRSDIQKKTEKQFFELIWKDDFQEVKITDEFSVEVINEHGRNAINKLSAGERQALALSFMAALKNISGYDFPVVIDTPLGRISEEPRLNIAENLPNYLEGTQLTLLVTNTEYDEKFKDRIQGEVGEEYVLDFDETTSSTTVKRR